jgi:DNA-directed RNA polymerase subunit RPC12/RpoP
MKQICCNCWSQFLEIEILSNDDGNDCCPDCGSTEFAPINNDN